MASQAADRRAALEREFAESAEPFMRGYCFRCHGKDKLRGDFDLRGLLTFDGFMRDEHRALMLLDQVSAAQMPPEDARQPAADARAGFTNWVHRLHRYVAEKNAGDPGVVLARRLSNAEYDYSIRDLTGVDIRPTREFPVDPANEAGFDNSGESLVMSPALVKKYLDVAREVSSHLMLTPKGIRFAPHPMIADTDRDKYCVKRIIDFYSRQPTNYAPYFYAAWHMRNGASLELTAKEHRLSANYLRLIRETLQDSAQPGPIAALQVFWTRLEKTNDEKEAREICDRLSSFVSELRQCVKIDVGNLRMNSANPGTQALVLWKDREMAKNRRTYSGGGLQLSYSEFVKDPEVLSALTAPDDEPERERFEAGFHRFCDLFPDAFFVSERARIFTDAKEDKFNVGRHLSAGFHNQFGYFRDDQPLYDLILDERGRVELDALWEELDFIALAPLRQYSSSIWFDRAEAGFLRDREFDPFRAEDKDCASPEKYRRYQEVYMAKVRRNTENPVVIAAFEDHFRILEASIRNVERGRLSSEPAHLDALADFAGRAYRRPITSAERDDLLMFYKLLRAESGLEHEEAVRECVVSVLMSPAYLYRTDAAGSGDSVQPLDDFSLASRLSYFLWSSLPDEELLAHASSGDLHEPAVLVAQAKRMLCDARVRGLVTEFAGNWLEFRRFEEHNAVDRERFKAFNNDLRQAMFEEPVRLFLEIFQNGGSVLDLLFADYTFANGVLAAHYGFSRTTEKMDEWSRFEHVSEYGRGGLLPMAVFLTKTSPGLRTSPVKRGYWVVRRVLGEHIPPPPPKVPELPSDESKLELSLRDMLARHREDKSCAACHARFDSFGLVLEGFGPIGEPRRADLAGRTVETRAPFPDGSERDGLNGLRDYIKAQRQNDFLQTFCRKLLAFALGRSLRLSDEILVEQMRANLEKNGYTPLSAIETIVTSNQFLRKRTNREFTTN
jgi:hypothetical protein